MGIYIQNVHLVPGTAISNAAAMETPIFYVAEFISVITDTGADAAT